MLHENLEKLIIATIIGIVALYLLIPWDFMLKREPQSPAIIPHEDPGTIEVAFSGISSLKLGYNYLDLILQTSPEGIEAALAKTSFISLPQNLKEVTDNFTSSSLRLARRMETIKKDLAVLIILKKQFRLNEAIEQTTQTSDNLSQAFSDLRHIKQATKIIGKELEVAVSPAESDLRSSYNEVLKRIERLTKMLDSYQTDLTGLPLEIKRMEFLMPTEISLKIEPMSAFVGDTIHFNGIEILVDILGNGRICIGITIHFFTVSTPIRIHV